MDNTMLVDIIRQEYDLPVERLTYLKQAWVAHCYAVDCAGGDRFFLKFYEQERQARFYARDVEFYLSMSHQLHSKRILSDVAYPVPTRDRQFALSFGDHLLILFPWIEGRTIGFVRFEDDILARVATLVGKLHKSTLQIEWSDPPRERFDLPFEENLRRGLRELEEVMPSDTAGKQELRDLLLPHRNDVLGLLDRLRELQSLVRAQEHEMVICHTDLHGGNLMVDEQGKLHIVDWESSLLAPPEHDLHFFAWDERFWDLFLPRYEAAYHPVRLGSATFGFYYYRRNLEDLAEWVVRILYETNGAEQDRADLGGIREGCISGWPYLEKTIAGIKRGLEIRRQTSL